MVIKTRVFGEIEIDDTKIITFESGIIGFTCMIFPVAFSAAS